MKKILVTGGAGFIGSHLVRHFLKKYINYKIVNLDALTYSGNLKNLKDVESFSNYQFIKGDITDEGFIDYLFEKEAFDAVIHLAAESHVDRSIKDPLLFAKTNILGTLVLLNSARKHWKNTKDKLFSFLSTDEIYGSLGKTQFFLETSPLDPHSPYSASKASSNHLVKVFYDTYGLPTIIFNSSNAYGSYQFPEKFIPLMIQSIINSKPIPIYGDGQNIRDWLWVEDLVRAIDAIFHKGRIGQTYNIGGCNEIKNVDLVYLICNMMDTKLNRQHGESAKLIKFVKDRPGHDKRYAIDPSKLVNEIGWKPSLKFHEALDRTINWYVDNKEWLDEIKSAVHMD